MKTTFIAMALFAVSVSAMGKVQPEKIIGIAVNGYSEEYYAEQAEAWSKEARKHPKSEEAWKNYFMATFYSDKNLDEEDKQLDFVVAEMSEAIPDTYTYYYCMYRYASTNYMYNDEDMKEFAESALSKLPEKKDFFDFDVWTVYFFVNNDFARLRPYAKEYLESGIYCDYLIDYSRNELAGMEKGAIVLGNTDVNLIPKILIKYGYGEHADKDIILFDNLLSDSLYREKVRSTLGITYSCTLPEEIESWDDIYNTQNEVFKSIVKDTNRPVYMSHIDIDRNANWFENFSRIGLAYKYYTTPMSEEDCMPMAQEALSHYDMDFFCKPASSEKWSSCNNLACHALSGFFNLVVLYADKGDGPKCRQLGNVSKSLVKGCNLYDEYERENICEEIDNYIVKSELYNF